MFDDEIYNLLKCIEESSLHKIDIITLHRLLKWDIITVELVVKECLKLDYLIKNKIENSIMYSITDKGYAFIYKYSKNRHIKNRELYFIPFCISLLFFILSIISSIIINLLMK